MFAASVERPPNHFRTENSFNHFKSLIQNGSVMQITYSAFCFISASFNLVILCLLDIASACFSMSFSYCICKCALYVCLCDYVNICMILCYYICKCSRELSLLRIQIVFSLSYPTFSCKADVITTTPQNPTNFVHGFIAYVFQLSILHVVFQLFILHVDVMQLISANMIFFFFLVITKRPSA